MPQLADLPMNGNPTEDGLSSSPFTLENIPFGIISISQDPKRKCATAYGEWAVDLEALETLGLFDNISDLKPGVFSDDSLNAFAATPKHTRKLVRERLILYLSKADVTQTLPDTFIPLSTVQNHYPMDTRNFSDFYCSLEHTQNCTEIFGMVNINPNWYTAPMVYNGRTSSLVVSGTAVTRPCGVVHTDDPDTPYKFLPTAKLDFELEIGVFLCKPLARGERLTTAEANDHIFGFVLLNDWSSRDIQVFEMPPLGPFHGKGFATSISPWIITTEALELVESNRAGPQLPAPLPHLGWRGKESEATFDIELSVSVKRNGKSITLGTSNLKELHWTPYQQLTHLVSAGEGLSTGDIFGTGTISSNRTNEFGEKIGLGCIYERSLAKNRLKAINDIAETYLQDGDEVVMDGWCVSKVSGKRFGFGNCSGVVTPAVSIAP